MFSALHKPMPTYSTSRYFLDDLHNIDNIYFVDLLQFLMLLPLECCFVMLELYQD